MCKFFCNFAAIFVKKMGKYAKYRVLLTGVGAPGVQGTLYSLRTLDTFIVGTDTDAEAVGKYLCDAFFTIAPAREIERYLADLENLCEAEDIDVIVPQNTAELGILARSKARFDALGTKVMVSDEAAIARANNKYELLLCARKLGINTGEFALCSDYTHLVNEVASRKARGLFTVVKPPCGNGSRGVRVIIDEADRDRKSDFYNQKPSSLYCTLDELHGILGDTFPELLVMDYLPGDEYTVDVLRTDEQLVAIPRKREVMRSGITFRASLEKNEEIIRASRLLAEALDLRYCFGFQFKKDAQGRPVLLECNPRVQGTMVLSAMAGANIIAASVRDLLGLEPEPIDIDWTVRLVRYWGAIGVNDEGVVRI